MCHRVQLFLELHHAVFSGDFDHFVKLINEKRNIFDELTNRLVVTLISKIIERQRNKFFDFLLPLLSPSHLYHPLKYAVEHERMKPYACKLIENGAPLDALQDTLFANMYIADLKMMKLVLSKGLDPNITFYGESKLLHSSLYEFGHSWDYHSSEEIECLDETVAMLLYYGADVSSKWTYNRLTSSGQIADCIVYNDALKLVSGRTQVSDFVFEQIFLHTFDDTQTYQSIHLSTFLELAGNTQNYSGLRKSLMDELLNYELEFVVEEDEDRVLLFDSFVAMEFSLFEITARKFPNAVCAILEEVHFRGDLLSGKIYHNFLKMMEYLITREFFFNHVVEFIENLDALEVCETGTELALFMIQYGLKCDTRMYHAVYKKYGDCVLFRTLLHLDVDEYPLDEENKSVMASFISDVNLTVPIFVDSITAKDWFLINSLFGTFGRRISLQTPYGSLTENEAVDLLDVFVHPKLINFLLSTENLPISVFRKIHLLPRVPSLHEVTRDTLRKHIVDSFHVDTTKQFYSIVNRLPIADEHRKIITFERKLYH